MCKFRDFGEFGPLLSFLSTLAPAFVLLDKFYLRTRAILSYWRSYFGTRLSKSGTALLVLSPGAFEGCSTKFT